MDIARKIKAQQRQAMKDGKYVGGRTPYGYLKAPDNCHQLIVDPVAAEVVKTMFQWAAEGAGLNTIAVRLNEAGYLSPSHYKRTLGEITHENLVGNGQCSEYEKQLEALRDQKQSLFERYLLGQIELDTYKSEKAVYDAEILKVKNAYAAVTAQAKLKREEQARQSSRQEIAHSIAEADVLTSELTDLLIEKVYVFPDNRIEIVYKVHDLFE